MLGWKFQLFFCALGYLGHLADYCSWGTYRTSFRGWLKCPLRRFLCCCRSLGGNSSCFLLFGCRNIEWTMWKVGLFLGRTCDRLLGWLKLCHHGCRKGEKRRFRKSELLVLWKLNFIADFCCFEWCFPLIKGCSWFANFEWGLRRGLEICRRLSLVYHFWACGRKSCRCCYLFLLWDFLSLKAFSY